MCSLPRLALAVGLAALAIIIWVCLLRTGVLAGIIIAFDNP